MTPSNEWSSMDDFGNDIDVKFYINERNGDVFFTISKNRKIKMIDGEKFIEVKKNGGRYIWMRLDSLKEIPAKEWMEARKKRYLPKS